MKEYLKNKKVLASIALACLFVFVLGPIFVDVVERLVPNFFLSKFTDWFPFLYSHYEAALRIYIISFLLMASAWFLLTAKLSEMELRQKIMLTAFLSAFSIVIAVLLFDNTLLYIEESKIAFFTSAALLFTGIVALGNAYITKARVSFVWVFLAIASFLAGIDEILALHERIGALIESSFSVSHAFTDIITVIAAVALIAFIYVLYKKFRDLLAGKNMLALKTMAFAGLLFMLAVSLDTFDIAAEAFGKTAFEGIYVMTGVVFPQQTFIFYNPHILLNSIEEIFEFFGAVTLAVACIFGFLEANNFLHLKRYSRKQLTGVQFNETRLNVFLFAIGTLIIIGWALSPAKIIDDAEFKAEIVLGPQDGMRHADDLFYDPEVGLVVGNEGGGNIILINGNGVSTLSFPEMKDTDSVTVYNGRIYASDSKSRKIFEIWKKTLNVFKESEEGSFNIPEGIAFGSDGSLIVLDESLGKVFKLKGNTIEAIASKSDGIFFPEGIAIGKNGEIYVTDDVQGMLFLLDEDMTVVASKRNGLINPEDITISPQGNIYITDNGAKAIFKISGGNVTKLVSFSDNYSDLQGIAIDDEGSLYVVTSDGYASQSVMPSFIIKITAEGGNGFE